MRNVEHWVKHTVQSSISKSKHNFALSSGTNTVVSRKPSLVFKGTSKLKETVRADKLELCDRRVMTCLLRVVPLAFRALELKSFAQNRVERYSAPNQVSALGLAANAKRCDPLDSFRWVASLCCFTEVSAEVAAVVCC